MISQLISETKVIIITKLLLKCDPFLEYLEAYLHGDAKQ